MDKAVAIADADAGQYDVDGGVGVSVAEVDEVGECAWVVVYGHLWDRIFAFGGNVVQGSVACTPCEGKSAICCKTAFKCEEAVDCACTNA